MRILIIGSGNYVTGRGTDSYGTILPAIYEFNKEKKIVDEVVILTTSKKSAKLAEKKNKKIRYLSGHNLRVKIVVKKKIILNFLITVLIKEMGYFVQLFPRLIIRTISL